MKHRAGRDSAAHHYRWVMMGSGLGGGFRYLISSSFGHEGLAGFVQIPTLVANVSGCVLMGILAAVIEARMRGFRNPRMRHFLLVGFCGGLTTFSYLSLESYQLWSASEWLAAMMYPLFSVLLSLLALWVGYRLTSWRALP